MTDLPDWTTQQEPGGIRSLGSIAGDGTIKSLTVTLRPNERSIILMFSGSGDGSDVTVESHTLGIVTMGVHWLLGAIQSPVVAYAPIDLDTQWDVQLGATTAGHTVYVFADSQFPITTLSTPYNFPALTLLTEPNPGAGSGAAGPWYDQRPMADSLPVVIASDQPAIGAYPDRRQVYDYLAAGQGLQGAPVGVTVPAVVGKYPEVDYLSGAIYIATTNPTGTLVRLQVRDTTTGAILHSILLGCSGTQYATSVPYIAGPGLGIVGGQGHALAVEFTNIAAPFAGDISVGAYYA